MLEIPLFWQLCLLLILFLGFLSIWFVWGLFLIIKLIKLFYYGLNDLIMCVIHLGKSKKSLMLLKIFKKASLVSLLESQGN